MQGKEAKDAGHDPSIDFEQVQSNLSLVEECKLNRESEPCYESPDIDNMETRSGETAVFEEFQPVAFFFLRREKCPRRWFIKLVTWPYFERLSIFVILVNCVTLGLYDPFDPECVSQRCQVLDVMEKVIYAFFLAEMLCKWMAMGLFGKLAYFAESWNRLDCFIVAAGTFELLYNEGKYLSAVRAIRVLRPLRAINRVPSIRILVTLLLDTLPMLWNVLAICFFIFAIFGIVGVQLWSGRLRGRCFLNLPANVSAAGFNLTEFYIPPDQMDFVCSTPDVSGMVTCDGGLIPSYENSARVCTLDYESYVKQTQNSNNSNACINWNQYYNVCKQKGDNPFWGAIGFDNIFIAWVAIFQVITLEGWSDIMYFVQDAHGFWNWIYFVILIVIASYFMTNLCLVVITTQFQETKQRENELLKESRRRQGTSTSTISSSRYDRDGCWVEILRYIEHLVRRFKRRMNSRFHWKYCEGKNKRTITSKHKNRRRKKNKHVYHHHHHHHHHHHYHHHVHCTDPGCPCGEMGQQIPMNPGSVNATSEASSSHFRRLQPKPEKNVTTGNTLTVPGQLPGQSQSNGESDSQPTTIPKISIITGSSCSVRKEPSGSIPGEMITNARAAVAINGRSAVADVSAHTFLSAASLSSATATATASTAAATAIQNACSCAMEHVEEDIKVDYESECVYQEDGDSESNLSTNDLESRRQRKVCSRFRRRCRSSVESKWFMYIIMAAIFLNTLSMGIEYHGQPQKMTDVLETLNYIFTAIFALEMLLKLIGLGSYGYIKDAFNLFDGAIVIISIVELFGDGESSVSVLRSFRLLRIFKLVRFLPALRRQLMVMIHTMDNVVTFLALLVLFIFTASILGMNLFGGEYDSSARAHFDDLFWALVTVFQILTQEDWNTVMYDGMRFTSKWAALYFILLMTIGNYILFNLLVAILVEGFANQPEKSGSAWSVKSKQETEQHSGMELIRCSGHAHPMVPIVCVSPTSPAENLARSGSRDDMIRDGYKDSADQEQYRRSSLPSLTTKSVLFRDDIHASAPTSPASLSPHVARKTLSFGDKTTKVIVNPVNAERCITSEDENEMSAREDDEENVIVQENSSWFARRKDWSLYIFSPSNRFRKCMVTVHCNEWFDRVVLFFIIFNCVVMALERPGLPKDSTMKKFIDICMYILLGIFTIEMMIKVIARGLWVPCKTAYLRSGWNVMDGFLVVISWIDVIVTLTTDTESSILGVLRVFRALRTLRPLRVISRAPGLKIVVETLISSLKPIGNIVLIAATFFIIFGILGVQLFKGKFYHCKDKEYPDVVTRQDCIDLGSVWINREYNFDNLAKALLTLFVFSTKDGWVTIMYQGLDAVKVDRQPIRNNQKWNVLYFVAFLLLAGFVVLNMLVGVVVENFQKCRDLMEKDRLAEKERKRAEQLQSAADEEEADDFPQPRRLVHRICTHGYFDLGIAAVIVLNVICMAMEHYNQPQELSEFLRWANYVFTVIFVIEGILKIYALGFKKYIKERWNQLDLLIIVLSIVGIILEEMNSELPINPTIIRVMRVLRIARVLKLLKTAEGIRKLLDTVAEALPQVGNLALLFLLLFFIFAALGMELFGEVDCTDSIPCEGLNEHAHFKNFGFAMLTLFRVSTGDNWNGILKDIINIKRCEENGSPSCLALEHVAPIYFAIFVLATQFVLLNVVVAVLMKHLEEAKEESTLGSLEGTDTVFAIQSDSADGEGNESRTRKRTGDGETAAASRNEQEGNSTNVVIRAHDHSDSKNDSLSSVNSIEQAVRNSDESRSLPRKDKTQRLQPIDRAPSDRSESVATMRLPPIGSQSRGLNFIMDDSSLSELSSPEHEPSCTRKLDVPMSPRAPIYVMSEDSDLNDNKIDDDHNRGKLFRPVFSAGKAKDVVYSASSLSSSEEETKANKKIPKRAHVKSDGKKTKAAKRDAKATSIVSPKPVTPESKPIKPVTRWASPVSNGENAEMKLHEYKSDGGDGKGKNRETQSYV